MSQSQISFNPDGSMRNWDYCPQVARTQLVRLIARLDVVPISLGESMCLKSMLKLLITLNLLGSLGKPPLEIFRSTSMKVRLN